MDSNQKWKLNFPKPSYFDSYNLFGNQYQESITDKSSEIREESLLAPKESETQTIHSHYVFFHKMITSEIFQLQQFNFRYLETKQSLYTMLSNKNLKLTCWQYFCSAENQSGFNDSWLQNFLLPSNYMQAVWWDLLPKSYFSSSFTYLWTPSDTTIRKEFVEDVV